MLNKLQQGQHGGIVGFMGALAQEFLKAKLDGKEEEFDPAMKQNVHSDQEVYAGTTARVPSNGVLDQWVPDRPAACSFGRIWLISHGLSANEHYFSLTPNQPTILSAMTYKLNELSNAIQAILVEHGPVTELVLKARMMLSKQGYTQQPGLYCSDENASVAFIC